MLTKYLLISMTLITFLTFGLDKWLAKKERGRISENVLLMLTFVGGTFGAVLGMVFFKHKTAKKSFFFKICVVVALQILLIFLLKNHLESDRL
ncbi:DUF1294 domain-containing protein [Chryseobacterium sp. MP_3.2]|uniref:DUF1294 domain-containing protein n=1 Tax=Chryseobacterium sp. MP_3.2 TaxID=3071712 RepID=UPI002E051947|nr:uncharacterized membrane protein YsdA (DUF1294 family) [Chryseobacterium sp. MP_3.2]